jgi:hypothetical protein
LTRTASDLVAGIIGVSIWGPGLEGWAASRPILAGAASYEPRPSPPPVPAILAPTERRRTGPVVRLALAVAHEAALSSGLPPGSLRSVFGSSNGDGVVVGGILEALAAARGDERVVSPTAFHNSVHNAAAGYWSIATASRQPATCLGAHDWTWAAALLKAVADVAADGEAVLLCCYDHPLPTPLAALRPTAWAYGAGLVLAPLGVGLPMATIRVGYSMTPPAPGAWAPQNPALHALAAGNAVAQSLRLLETLALRVSDRHAVPYLDGRLDIDVEGGEVDAGAG